MKRKATLLRDIKQTLLEYGHLDMTETFQYLQEDEWPYTVAVNRETETAEGFTTFSLHALFIRVGEEEVKVTLDDWPSEIPLDDLTRDELYDIDWLLTEVYKS